MARNDRLTELLLGHRITGTHVAGDILRVSFDDGSMMSVRIGGPWSPAVMGVPVEAVSQQDTTLHLGFKGGKTMVMHAATPMPRVMVCDRRNMVRYAD